ncbi:MAG: hypothetical protein CME93_04090 [Hyphomonadaceae bacterium]|nr:hypothetical protein [Hyphomonadaceae bacterium]OUX94564.1 MAG: hypothetical protein CBB77_05665 [Hyphomonas sp. TMED17]
MNKFSSTEIETLDRLWRSVPPDHIWTGWSQIGDQPDEILLYRKQSSWRQFSLRKIDGAIRLYDDNQQPTATIAALDALTDHIEQIPSRAG